MTKIIYARDEMPEFIEPIINDYTKFEQHELNSAFHDACKNGDLNLVKYLLTSSELKKHADINYIDFIGLSGLCRAGSHGQLDIVKYLLTSNELKSHADIHANNDYPFVYACNNKQLEVVRFFIFDMNIEKSRSITSHLEKHPNEVVENMFKIRDLNNTLNTDLNISDKNIEKKMKL